MLQLTNPQNAIPVNTLLEMVNFKCKQVKWFSLGHTLSIRRGLVSYIMRNIFIKSKPL